jgi:hypothetical protein
MNGDEVQFVFYLIGHMLRWCNSGSLEHAIEMAVHDVNIVLDAHNKAVWNVRHGGHYSVSTGGNPYMSDNQCVLLGMLREDTTYKRIEEHTLRAMGIDV